MTFFKTIIPQANKRLFSILALIYLISFLGKHHFVFDLLNHFVVQYTFLFFLSTIVFFLAKSHLFWKLCSSIFLLINVLDIIPWYIPEKGQFNPEHDRISLYYSNVLTSNQAYEQTIQQIKKFNPDIIALVETDSHWINHLSPLEASYPYHKLIPRSDNFGISIYSKLPFHNIKTKYYSKTRIPSIYGEISMNGTTSHIIVTHPVPPMSGHSFNSRNGQLEYLSKHIQKLKGPCIVVGDFNITMWSPIYKTFIKETKLNNCRKGYGIQSTWNSPFSFIQLPIDHCFVSSDIQTEHFEVLSNTGADHNPLLMQLKIPHQ